ncbi:MAG: hypothetical protein ACREJB_17380, partial [Planctomycetaceae bacterium]
SARVRLAVSYDAGGPAFESHRTWIYHNEAYLEDAGGESVPPAGPLRTSLEGDGAVAVEYEFRPLPSPLDQYRLVYVAPTLIVETPIAFRLSAKPQAPVGAQ